MPKETIKIELSEKELKEILAKEFSLKLENLQLNVYHYEGDQREPAYTKIVLESERKK